MPRLSINSDVVCALNYCRSFDVSFKCAVLLVVVPNLAICELNGPTATKAFEDSVGSELRLL